MIGLNYSTKEHLDTVGIPHTLYERSNHDPLKDREEMGEWMERSLAQLYRHWSKGLLYQQFVHCQDHLALISASPTVR